MPCAKLILWVNVTIRVSAFDYDQNQMELADRKYITSVYFHTLFLYTITKNRKYRITQTSENNEEHSIDIGTYLKDLFTSYYSEFILNFGGMEEMMQGLGD